jgi:hypothetical protein
MEEAARPTRFRKVVCTATPGAALLSLFFFSFHFLALALSLTNLDPHPPRADARRTPLMPSWHFSSRRAHEYARPIGWTCLSKRKMQCPCVRPPVHIFDKKKHPLATIDIKNLYLRRLINEFILGRRSDAIWSDRVEHCSFRSVVLHARARETLRSRLWMPPGPSASGINRKRSLRQTKAWNFGG